MNSASFAEKLSFGQEESFWERKLKSEEVERTGHIQITGGNTFRIGSVSPEWRDCHA